MVDNCYGEFVERLEPSDFDADMIVGSLIKNPGGGLAPIGGYIAGTKECVERAAYRLTCSGPRQGGRCVSGRYDAAFIRDFSWLRRSRRPPLKGAIFAANVYERLGLCGSAGRHRDAAMTSFRR